MPKPYNQYVPPVLENGTVIKNWRVTELAHRSVYKDGRGVPRSTIRFYHCHCINCKISAIKSISSMKVGGCRNCSLLPKGYSGVSRAFGNYKRAAKKMKREFTITFKKFRELSGSRCHYCGAPPLLTCKSNNPNQKSDWGNCQCNGIDRINNNKGYTNENTVPCCFLCNRAKNSMTYRDFSDYWIKIISRIKSGETPAVFSPHAQDNDLAGSVHHFIDYDEFSSMNF
jgi:hypothetical protein